MPLTGGMNSPTVVDGQTPRPPIESALAQHEAEIRMLRQEVAKFQEDKKAMERLMKAKESALLEASKKVETAEAKALAVEDLQNKNQELLKEIEAREEEMKVLDKVNRAKVAEIEKMSAQVTDLQEALTASGANQNTLLDQERQIQELQEDKKIRERELARAKATAHKVASAVANEWKDENDKVIPIKQWLDERHFMQGEIQALKDKLSQAERSAKSEAQIKDRIQGRLKVIEDGIKSGTLTSLSGSRRSSHTGKAATAVEDSPHRASSGQDVGEGESSPTVRPGAEDMVSSVLYDALQKEVVGLRKSVQEKEQTLRDKEDAIEMLNRKVDTITKSLEVEMKKSKRELTSMERELAAMKVELANKEQENKTSRRTSLVNNKQGGIPAASTPTGTSTSQTRPTVLTPSKSPRSPITPLASPQAPQTPPPPAKVPSPKTASSTPSAGASRIPTPAGARLAVKVGTFGSAPRPTSTTPSRIPTPGTTTSMRRSS